MRTTSAEDKPTDLDKEFKQSWSCWVLEGFLMGFSGPSDDQDTSRSSVVDLGG